MTALANWDYIQGAYSIEGGTHYPMGTFPIDASNEVARTTNRLFRNQDCKDLRSLQDSLELLAEGVRNGDPVRSRMLTQRRQEISAGIERIESDIRRVEEIRQAENDRPLDKTKYALIAALIFTAMGLGIFFLATSSAVASPVAETLSYVYWAFIGLGSLCGIYASVQYSIDIGRIQRAIRMEAQRRDQE